MTTHYTTRDEFEGEVIAAIEHGGSATADEFNIDAIVDDNLTWDDNAQAYHQHTSTAEFWQSVERHAR